MAHTSLRLIPTVDAIKTPTLNEAALSSSQLIRYQLDSGGQSFIQKRGGWSKWFPNALPSTCRALWAWQDINGSKWLATGCIYNGLTQGGPLYAISPSGMQITITPRFAGGSTPVSVTTNTTTNTVIITDIGSNISSFDSVMIDTHIAVGGIVIFGFYPCTGISANTYSINLLDKLGNPVIPTSVVVNGGVVENFSVVAGSAVITVTLPNHGFAVGDTYTCMRTQNLSGIAIVGDYLVQTVTGANTFTVLGSTSAVNTFNNIPLNGGNAFYTYYLAFGALPTGSGYGVGGYGIGGYGTGTGQSGAQQGSPMIIYDWTLDNWASLLIACPIDTIVNSPDDGVTHVGGPIFYWDPLGTTPTGTVMSYGPIANGGAFVAMPQRQVVAFRSTFTGVQDPLLIRWCDANNFFQWISTPINLAGSKRLTRGSEIRVGLQMAQQLVFITDVGLWTGQFIGGSDVYAWNEVATGCGVITQRAANTLHDTLYWMSQSQFFTFDANGVQPLPCSVRDIIFDNLTTNATFQKNIRCATNSYHNEVEFQFPSKASVSGENDSYIKYNSVAKGWDYGISTSSQSVGRTAWINQSVLGPPIGTDSVTNFIYQHEISNDADGQALLNSFTTGFAVLDEGDELMFIDQFWPDMKWGKNGSTPSATLQLSFIVAEYPTEVENGTALTFGPFPLNIAVQYISPRFRGRLVALQFTGSDVGTFWRLGLPRYRAQRDGKFL